VSLEVAVHARNARFRAWAQSGVPVEGGWEYRPKAWSPGVPGANLNVGCSACGRRVNGLYPEQEIRRLGGLARLESITPERRPICSHLAPLLSPEDPEAVVALTALEMLSTG
jgi:hypothetical protein